MAENVDRLSRELHTEATDLIRNTELRQALGRAGEAVIGGSYALDLLVWRDLDCQVCVPRLDLGSCFEVGRILAEQMKPRKMHFRDERASSEPGLPVGLYWGLYQVPAVGGTWKVDVWLVEKRQFDRMNGYLDQLRQRITPETRRIILEVKSQCWTHPQYRREFCSVDIYSAVLDHDVMSIAAFRQFIKETRRVSL